MHAKYKAGDQVLIKLQKGKRYGIGIAQEMFAHSGQIMTIRHVNTYSIGYFSYYMEEDKDEFNGNIRPGWIWPEECIVGLADEVMNTYQTDIVKELL